MNMSGGYDSVLMIGWEYPPHNSGGLGVACEGLTQALADHNTQVYFTLPYQHTAALDHMQLVSCVDPSWSTANGGPPFSVYAPQLPTRYRQIDADELHALPQSELEQRVEMYAQVVAEQTKAVQSEVGLIHAHDWMSFPAAAQLKAATGKPVIAHVHSTEHDRIPNGLGSSYILQTEAAGMAMADKIIAVSYYTKKLLVEKYGIDPAKIEVVHNGVSPVSPSLPSARAEFAPGQPVIVFMGRLTQQKGGEFFVKLATQVLRERPDALFVIAGHGDLYHELLFRAAYDKLSAAVLFSGFLRDAQRDKLLNRADIFVMPSLSEPFGLVALEAAQRHTPVIVSKQAGVSEVLPSAISVDFWDVDKMTRTILELLSNKGYAERVTTSQLREVADVTWDRAADKVKHIYRQAFLGR